AHYGTNNEYSRQNGCERQRHGPKEIIEMNRLQIFKCQGQHNPEHDQGENDDDYTAHKKKPLPTTGLDGSVIVSTRTIELCAFAFKRTRACQLMARGFQPFALRRLPFAPDPLASRTRSRNALPGLKCGTYFAATATTSPVLGFRARRGGR